MTRSIGSVFVLAALLVPRFALGQDVLGFEGRTMGTTYSVKVVSVPGASVEELPDAVDTALAEVNQQMSTWIDDSELSRFNVSRSTDWFPVSPATLSVVREADRVSRLTDGLFDATIAPLIDLWSFGSEKGSRQPPADDAIESVMSRCGYEKLTHRDDPPAIKKSLPGLSVNLSAIAKGYGVDRVIEVLQQRGYSAALVEIGGEVRAIGTKPDGSPWRIAIERPVTSERSFQRIVPLSNNAVATSGDYRIFFEHEGQRFSHEIDPRTGKPVRHQLAAATVITESCMTADALATALMVMGPDDGYNFAETHGIAAFFIVRTGDGFSERMSSAFAPFDQSPVAAPAAGAAATPVKPVESSEPVVNFRVFFVAAGIFALAMVGMAVGVIVSNRRLRGSCGGLNGLQDETGQTMCQMCTTPSEDCTGQPATQPDCPEATSPGT